MEETVKTPIWKPALIYGAIVGFTSIFLGVVFYILDLSTKGWVNWVSGLVALAVLIYCLVAYRNEYLGGFASYGQILLMAVLIGVITSVLTALYSYILMGVIDPDLIDKLRLVQEEKIMNNPRIPESMQDDVIEKLARTFQLKRMIIMSAIVNPLFYFIIGLIAAAFIKREETPASGVV